MILSWTELSLRLVLAAIFGAAIGMERERKDWAAGIRTHMMVSMGSALIMLVSSFGFNDLFGRTNVTLDPSRVAAQIVSGIGFIGAGAILFRKPGKVIGLTTASGLWTVCGIGMATGGGMYFAACAATLLSLIILWGIQPLQKKFSPKFQNKSLTIIVEDDTNPKKVINKLMEDKQIDFANFSITRQKKSIMIELSLDSTASVELKKIVSNLHEESYIKKVTWNN